MSSKVISNGKKHISLFGKEMKKNGALYMMFLPAAVFLIIFNYLPLGGLVIAFKDLNFVDGMFGSDWMHPLFENFRFLFSSKSAIRAFVNTLVLNLIFIVMGVICEVGLALLLNEIRGKFFKKITQTFTLLPYFVSWVVVGAFIYNLFSTDHGIINSILEKFGHEGIGNYFNNN